MSHGYEAHPSTEVGRQSVFPPPASKSSPPDSPSSLRSIPLLSHKKKKKKRSHISIVRWDCQRRRPSSSPRQPPPPHPNALGGRRGAAAAQITAPPVLSDAVADVVLLIALRGWKHLCWRASVYVCVHVFPNASKRFRYRHIFSPHRDTPNTFLFFLFF